MNQRIRRLTPTVAAQIAAGEVIERPVSVVKELLENSLDAQATKIRIYIYGGGLREIRIEDNGIGIAESDLNLAIEPHATSKIVSLSDLYQTKTKGFRGEALASIASVSKLQLLSKPKAQDHAVCLQCEGNSTVVQACVHGDGTTIIVKDLFYNLPVRKKFLKSEHYEWQAIESLVKKISLSAPEVHISLFYEDEMMIDLPSATILEEHLHRIKKLWGRKFSEQAQYLSIERSDLKIWGWLGALEEHRSQNDRLWVYLNGRIIHDKLIIQSLRQLYVPLVPVGRHPQCVLYLEVPTCMVDINVHPAKHEVRFEQPRLIFDFMISSLKTYWHGRLTSDVDKGSGFCSPVAAMTTMNMGREPVYTICNSDFIILPVNGQVYYLIDVLQWWQYHLKQVLAREPVPWPSRLLAMPIIKEVPTIEPAQQSLIEDKLRLWGMDLQFWGSHKVCIRAIPECIVQLDFQVWLKTFKPHMTVDEIGLNDLFAASQLCAYDLDAQRIECLIVDVQQALNISHADLFAKCLDPANCRKLFK